MLVYPSDLHGDPQGCKVLVSSRSSRQMPCRADVQLHGFTIVERMDASIPKSTDTSSCAKESESACRSLGIKILCRHV